MDFRTRVRLPAEKELFSSPPRPDPIRGPPSLLSSGYWVCFAGGEAARPLTTHLNLVPWSGMRGATPPPFSYVFLAWCLI